MLDSAATQCCIAKRCVNSSASLRTLHPKPYRGMPLLDANQRPLAVLHVITVQFATGTPECKLTVDMVVVDDLPYSCIIGTSLLSKLNCWGVDNISSTLRLNSSVVQVHDSPEHDEQINLITSGKTRLAPGESKFIKAVATGPGIAASRPFTEQLWMLEGLPEKESRCSVRVCPALNVIGARNDNVVNLKVTNTSDRWRSVGKRVKIATAHKDFSEIDESDINSESGKNCATEKDLVKLLCNRSNLQHLSEEQYQKVKSLVVEYKDVFSISSNIMGRASNSQFDIDVDNMAPVAIPIRRIPLHKEHIVKELIDRYVELGLIEEIDSPFRAAMVLVEKKAVGDTVMDRYRLAVDYRKLNEQLPDSGWPAPSIEHCLDAAAGSVYMSKLDFNNGYYQIPCTESAKYALAFSPGIGFRQYSFNGMPNGAKSAASIFQQAMENTFKGLEECILPPYYDDVNVKGRTFDEHLKNLRRSLQRVRDHGYTLNALKCSLFQTKVKYLGHIVENGKISMDPDRVKAIVNIPVPHDVKSLRRFIGMAQFCCRFLPHLNSKVAPLSNLLKKNVEFVWSTECQDAFDYVKRKLSEPPVLCLPTARDNFILETDAADAGLGGCLKVQSKLHHNELIVGYHSEKFKDQQTRWHIVEKEAFAILSSVDKFRHYLIGKRFTLKTDNRILTYMKTSRSKKLANWALQLSDYDFDIVHIPSSDNRISDFFSRLYEHVNIISVMQPSITMEDIRTAQEADEHMAQAFLYVQCKRNFDVEKLGPLKRYRKFLSTSEDNVLLWKDKIVLPQQFRSRLLEVAHDHPAAGHFAVDRTWKNVSAKFFWPNALEDVTNWVRSCDACNEHSVKQFVNRPLNPIISEERFELVTYDLAGPFTPSKGNNNLYALIIVDHFSKWPEIVPLRNIRASTIATAIFEEWCCRYGVMTQLHSDGANNVHGHVLKELCDIIGTVKSKSSRLHPQGDGMSEAMVKILKNSIRKQVDEHGSDWDQYLQATAFAVRTSINNSTQCTPAELVLGANLMRPLDVLTPECAPSNREPINIRQAREFATRLTRKIDESSKVVQQNLQKSRKKMKRTYDKRTSRHDIKAGDYVMLWWPYFKKGVSRALQPKWKGPFLVEKLIDSTNCTLVLKDGTLKHVHLNQVKPVEQRAIEITHPHTTPTLSTDSSSSLAEVFEDLCAEEESEYESANESFADDDDQWCGISADNVIESRTRSGNRGGGGIVVIGHS